jgi:hypothetical protein
MSANVKFYKLSDDTDITSGVIQLTPYVLYRGMAVAQEYHEIYAKNEGTVLVNPTHTFSFVSGVSYAHVARQVTGSTKDGGSTSTVYITYAALTISACPTTLISDTNNQMANGRCYDLWSKVLIDSDSGIGTVRRRHSIGGSEPA